MHVHDADVRTTIELDDKLREALIKRAAERGDKGYSRLIEDALREYLARHESSEREQRAAAIRAVTGSFSEEEADQMEAVIKEVRRTWRGGSSIPTS